MKAAFPYQRLGPRTPHVFGHDSLWLGADHVLAVHNARFVEDYRRFDLREVQAIMIRRQFRFIVPVYWLFFSAVGLIAAIAGTVSGNRALADSGWGVLTLLAIYWLGASLFGSCACHLQTAVDSYELRGLYRSWTARRALQTLESKIAEVQGIMPADWSVEDSDEPALPRAKAGIPSPILIPALACAALLLDALISWLVRGANAPRIVRTAGVLATLIAVVLPIVSLVVTRRDKRFQHIRILFLIAVFAVGLANYGNTVMTAFLTGLQRVGQPVPAPIAAVPDVLYWVNQIAELAVGTLGLLDLLGEARGGTPGRQPSAP